MGASMSHRPPLRRSEVDMDQQRLLDQGIYTIRIGRVQRQQLAEMRDQTVSEAAQHSKRLSRRQGIDHDQHI